MQGGTRLTKYDLYFAESVWLGFHDRCMWGVDGSGVGALFDGRSIGQARCVHLVGQVCTLSIWYNVANPT